jgi:sortase A
LGWIAGASEGESVQWLRWSSRILMGVGLALVLFWVAARVHRVVMSRSDLKEFEQARESLKTERIPPPEVGEQRSLPEQLPVDFTLWSEARVRHYEDSLSAELGLPLAVMRVPAIELEVPVLDGTDEVTLNRAVGWIPGTSRPGYAGNLGVAGHRDGFFRGLKDLRLGDEIEIETLTRKSIYVVDDLLIVDPDQTAVLEPTPSPTITLVTCYPFYHIGKAPRRYIVRGTLVDSAVLAGGVDEPATDSAERETKL